MTRKQLMEAVTKGEEWLFLDLEGESCLFDTVGVIRIADNAALMVNMPGAGLQHYGWTSKFMVKPTNEEIAWWMLVG